SEVVHVQSGVAKESGSTFFPDALTGTPLGRLTLLESVAQAYVYARDNGGVVPVPPQPGSRAASFRWFGRDLVGNFISGYLVGGLPGRIAGCGAELQEPVNTGQVNKWVAAVQAPVVQPPPVQIDLIAPDVAVVPDQSQQEVVEPVVVEVPVVPVEDLLAAAR